MLNNVNTNVERIIAKIDNDFNPDNSDWIPRVGAWCIDAMSQINVLPKTKVRKKLKVKNKIAYIGVNLSNAHLKVFDCNGCEIKEAEECSKCGVSSTGEVEQSNDSIELTPDTIDININHNASGSTYVQAETINSKEWPGRYNVIGYRAGNNKCNRNYVLTDCDKLEFNFETNCIIVEYEGIKTFCSQSYGCEVPVIPNNGVLIEAIVYYCMYKMLCRGYKHPVFNLNASQYGTNPYYIWNNLKDEAARSIINDGIDNKDDVTKLFRSAFFIQTFDSRR